MTLFLPLLCCAVEASFLTFLVVLQVLAKLLFHAVEWREISIFRSLPACFLFQMQLSLVYCM